MDRPSQAPRKLSLCSRERAPHRALCRQQETAVELQVFKLALGSHLPRPFPVQMIPCGMTCRLRALLAAEALP